MTTPESYNIKGRIALYRGDALVEMNLLDDGVFDLIILDPDYQEWDSMIEKGLICQAVRLLKRGGNIVCFTKQPFDFNLRNEIAPIFRREIVWTFTNGGAWVSNNLPLVSFQKIYWCSPFKDCFFNPRTGEAYSEGTKSFKRSSKVFGNYNEEGRQFTPSANGTWMRDHIHENKPECGAIPAKPSRLIQMLIHCLCPSDGAVLDPFMGSGIIGDVCKSMNMRYTGMEIDADRYNNIKNRLFQPTLFDFSE